MKKIAELIRVRHWVKNLFVFVPLVFARKFTSFDADLNAVLLFFLFNFVASAVYVINDLHDIEKDKNHPVKKNRPLASGAISKREAFTIIAALLLFSLAIVLFTELSPKAEKVALAYFVINLLYTFKLKKIAIVDILTISSGYVLRVYAGAFAVGVPVSQWLIVTVLFLALFLAAIKRGAEFRKKESENVTRVALEEYSGELIDVIVIVATTGVIISYLLYSISDKIYSEMHSYDFVVTAVFPIYGLFRALLLYYKDDKGEDAFELVLKDVPSLVNILLYGITVLLLLSKSL